MPDSTVNAIDFRKYLTLLREMVPDTVDLYACDTTGRQMASDENNSQQIIPNNIIIEIKLLSGLLCIPDESFSRHNKEDHQLIPVINTLDEPIAYLVATMNDNSDSSIETLSSLINKSASPVLSCIENEYQLTAELDAMASELAIRYEELNLVYETNDCITDSRDEYSALSELIEKYIDHLDVDMIALAFPKQEQIFSASNDKAPIPEAYDIVNTLCQTYLKQAKPGDNCLVINDFTDLQRNKYDLHTACKVMACPVLNNRGDVNGILVCINHIQRPDFYNSDKNLLHAVARKVAKIIQSNYDILTGLINQHAFKTIVQDAINRSRTKGLFHCVLNIDLDNLKVINETLGRDAGDHVIRNVADMLQNKLRSSDSVCYMGEGRYGVLLDQCNIDQGMSVAENLRTLIEVSTFSWKDKAVETSITIGVGLIEPHTHKLDEVLEAAEMARDAAKEIGYNRIQVYRQNDDDFTNRRDHLQWVTRIQQALRHNEFAVFAQTISPVAPTNESYHFEVLLRMLDKEGSVIPPGKFIPPAEQFNLMPIIDRWVINKTLELLSSAGFAQQAGEGIVSINLSGQSLTDNELTDYVIDKASKYHIDPECICFEITETAAIHDTRSAQNIFRQLKSHGFKLSLDDFGTGLSSFSYLREMPVDFLKIDGSFVRTILEDNVTSAMVGSINHVGHVMGLKTIAEFVETDEIITALKHIGVDFLQGYAIAKPVDLSTYLSELGSSTSALAG
jgi:diguanylate cyclase (GGDEF)-like protein